MPQQNLEQLRAAHALSRATTLDRQDTRKLPALILNNGFLAAAAFTLDSDARKGMRDVVVAIGQHLHQRSLLTQEPGGADNNLRVQALLNELSGKTSLDLQRATDEALAYLGYLKRFAPKRTNDDDSEE